MSLRLFFIPVLLLAFQLQAQTINWIKKNGPLGGQIIDIEVDPATGKIFLLDSDRRPYISTDNGGSWTRLTFSGSDRYFNDIEITNNTIFMVGGYDLYASTDGGVTFQQRMTNASPYQDGRRLKRMPVSGNLVVLAYNQLYTSSDNGQTWTPRAGLSSLDQLYHLEVNAVDQIFILKADALFEISPFRSSDGGVSFTEVASGIPAGYHTLSLAAENNGAKIYCLTNDNIFSSTDGSAWTSIKTGSLSDVLIADYPPGNSYLEFSADGLGMFFIDNVNHKLHSKTLAETTWSLRATGFPSATVTVTCASAKDYPAATSATAFFGTASGVFKTITGGASTSASNSGIASVRGEQILSDPNYGYLYLKTSASGTYDSELLKSQDQGNNWSKITGMPSQAKQFSRNESALFVVDVTNVLHRSYDNGNFWSALTPPSGGFTWAAGVDVDKVFGLNYSDWYYSLNNGETWTATPIVISGLPASFGINEETIRVASANRMFFRLNDYGLNETAYYSLQLTYDATGNISSATATKITTLPFSLNDVHKAEGANGKYYIYDTYSTSADRIAISENGGVTWVTRTVPKSSDFFVAENGYLFFADGSTEKVHVSRDGGLTFIETSLPSTLNVYDLKDITLDNNGFAYLAFDGEYLYQSANTIVLPSPLTDLEGIGQTATAVALRWVDPNTYERDIIIERSLNGTDFTTAGQVDGWDICYGTAVNRGYFVDANVLPGTTYTYRVKAKNAAGESAPGAAIVVTTPGSCIQTIPENRSWSAINSGTEGYTLLTTPKNVGIKHVGNGKYEISDLSLSLATSSAESSIFYEACGQTVVGEANRLNPNGNGTWDGTTLTLKWRSCSQDKTETISLTLNATDPAPLKPAALFAYVVSNTAIEIKWASGYYEKTYILERSLSASSGFSQITTADYPQTTFIDNVNLAEGTTYYYRLKALNGNTTPGESPYSDVVSVPFKKPNFIVANNAITDFKTTPTLSSIWADFNRDGLEDYFTMQFDDANQLAKPMIFENLGGGSFLQHLVNIGEGAYFWPSVADYDNDNFPDLIMSGDGTRLLDIFKGNGDFTFAKIPSGQLGDLGVIEKEVAATSLADINNDGLIDLMILNEEDGSFTFYKQNANHSFTKILQGDPSADEPLLAIWADYDNDGFQDVFLGSLNGTGRLFRNNGNETFTHVTGSGIDAGNFFSASWGDYNNDGYMDLFCGTVTMNALYKNNGDGTFTKNISTAISEANYTFSAAWGDYNNDGFLDLMAVAVTFTGSQSRLFLRDPSVTGSVAFNKITTEKINDLSLSHYSVAHADPDQNGLLDLAMSSFIFKDNGDRLLPTNNNFYQNNNLPGNWSEVKLNPASGSTEAMGARITLSAGATTQTRQIASLTSLVSRNSTIAHFGLGSATSITNIEVRWPNGGVQNYPLPPVNQILIIDEDLQGPAVISRAPAHSAADILTATTITIEFDENNLPVPGKKLYLTKTGETTAYTSVDVSTAAKSGNQYVFTLPVELQGETEYNVTLDAAAFRDRYANPSAAIAAGEWKFTTVPLADVESPVIVFTVPPSPNKGFGTVTAQITVTDNTAVNTVILSIRKISGSAYTEVSATLSGTDTYSVEINEGSHFDGNGAEFFITATDAAGNPARHPAGSGTHKIYLTYNEDQSAIPTLGFGGLKTSWKVFSIPFELINTNNRISVIFDELAGLDSKKDYRMLALNDARNDWEEYPSFTTIDRGQGYFINIKEDQTIKLPGTLTAPANARDNLFQITLQPGWNMVGNPYLTPISWADVSTLNGLTGTTAQFKKFSSGTYTNNQSIGAYEGGFVFSALTAPATIDIPFLGQTASGGRLASDVLGTDLNEDGWVLPLKLKQEQFTYDLSGIGMAPTADYSLDDFDDVTPPRFFDYLEVNFDHPEHNAKRFTRDVVPTQANYTWDFTVDSNLEGMAELSWNNLPLASSGKDLFLLDVSAQKLVNMKDANSYSFSPKETNPFRIYFGDNLNIAPERVQLGKAYPNPTNGLTTIAFSLPETGGLNQSVTIDILDALGRSSATVTNGTFNPGYHHSEIDASNLNHGFYTYRLTVKNKKGQTVEVNKLIIK